MRLKCGHLLLQLNGSPLIWLEPLAAGLRRASGGINLILNQPTGKSRLATRKFEWPSNSSSNSKVPSTALSGRIEFGRAPRPAGSIAKFPSAWISPRPQATARPIEGWIRHGESLQMEQIDLVSPLESVSSSSSALRLASPLGVIFLGPS